MRLGLLFFVVMLALLACNQPSHSNQSTATSTSDSIQYWANTARNSKTLALNERFNLLNRAYAQNQRLKNKEKKAKNLSRISLAYSFLNDSLNFRKTNRELIELSTEIGDKVAHGEAHWDLGDFVNKSKPDSAYFHYKEAYTLFLDAELGKNKAYPARILQRMANLRENNKDYAGAEKDIIAAIETYKSLGALDRMYQGYNTLGMIQNGLNKFDKAIEYQLRAKEYIQYVPNASQNQYELQNQNNIGAIHLRKGDFEKAYPLFHKLEERCLEIEEIGLLIRKVYASKAISGFKSGQLGAEEAIALLEKSNDGLDSIGDEYNQAKNRQYLAEILFSEDRKPQALENALKARAIAESTGNNDRLLNVLEFLTQADTENSDVHAKAYFQLNEQLQLQERSIQDKFARIQMETDEIIEENESLAKRTELLAGVAIGLLVLGIGIFTIISQRISNQRLKFKQRQQESNQEIYNLMLTQHGKLEEGKKSEQKRVSEELHDGILGQMLGIRLVLSGLNERNDPSAIEQRAELIVKLQELEEEIRTISHELSEAAYKKVHNFIISIGELIGSVSKSSGITISFEHDDHFNWDSLGGDVKINIYRVIQELLQNCVKHAQCESVQVAFQKDKNVLHLTVTDDGIGFDNTRGKHGIGLKNIVSRVKKMGAWLEIEGKPDQGTTVKIKIPNIDLKKQHPKAKNLRKTFMEA